MTDEGPILNKKNRGRPPKYHTKEEKERADVIRKRLYAREYYRNHREDINRERIEKYKNQRINYQYKVQSKYTRALNIEVIDQINL